MALASSTTSILSRLLLLLMLSNQGLQSPLKSPDTCHLTSEEPYPLNCSLIATEIMGKLPVSSWLRLAWCRLAPIGASSQQASWFFLPMSPQEINITEVDVKAILRVRAWPCFGGILGCHLSPAWVTSAMSFHPALFQFLHVSQLRELPSDSISLTPIWGAVHATALDGIMKVTF